jgi:hypothetical protein
VSIPRLRTIALLGSVPDFGVEVRSASTRLLAGSIAAAVAASTASLTMSAKDISAFWSVPFDPYVEEQGEPVSLFGG